MSEIGPKSTKIGIDRIHPDLKTMFGRIGIVYGVQNPKKDKKKSQNVKILIFWGKGSPHSYPRIEGGVYC